MQNWSNLCNGQTHLEQQHYIGLGKKRIEKARNPLFSPSVVVFRLHKMLLTLTVISPKSLRFALYVLRKHKQDVGGAQP